LFGFLPPFDRFSGDPFGIRVKALSLEPLDPYTLAVRAEEGSWGAGELELDARVAQRVAKKQNIYIWYPPPKTYHFHKSTGIYSKICYFWYVILDSGIWGMLYSVYIYIYIYT